MNSRSPFYIKTPFVMDRMEKHFYDVLLQAVESQYFVWPKVHLADLLEPKNESEQQGIYEKFSQLADKHVDFVLCKKEKFHPLLVIRFKGMISHPDDVYRSEVTILKEILNSAGIPLLIESATELDSYKTAVEYDSLRERIANILEPS